MWFKEISNISKTGEKKGVGLCCLRAGGGGMI